MLALVENHDVCLSPALQPIQVKNIGKMVPMNVEARHRIPTQLEVCAIFMLAVDSR